MAVIIFFVKFQPLPKSVSQSLQDIDYLGAFLFIGGTTSILIPVTWGGVMYDWSSWRTLVPLVLGLAGIAAFFGYERVFATKFFIPLSIFQTRTAIFTYFGTVAHGFILWTGLYYLPLYFQAVKGFGPIASGIALFPVTFTVAPGALITGLLITKTGRYRYAIWFGWALSTLGVGLCCIINPDTSKAEYVIFMVISGLGLGVSFSANAFAIQASVKPSDLAISVAMFSFFRALGQTIGVAIGGTVFQNRMRANLLTYPALSPHAVEYSKGAAALVDVIHAMQDGTDKYHLIRAYSDSLRILWAVCCALGGVAGILSIWTKEYTLDQVLRPEQALQEESVPKKETLENCDSEL